MERRGVLSLLALNFLRFSNVFICFVHFTTPLFSARIVPLAFQIYHLSTVLHTDLSKISVKQI